jgi:hypothetical protein
MGKVKKKEDIKVEASIWFEIIRNNSERKCVQRQNSQQTYRKESIKQ